MLGLLVVTHGRLAEDLVAAASNILGSRDAIEGLTLDWDGDVEDARRSIEEAIGRVDGGDGVLILTDMFGGTPSNLALSFHDPGRVEVVTGVNLPMLIKFTNLRGELRLEQAAAIVADQGRQSIQVASELLRAPETKPEGGSA